MKRLLQGWAVASAGATVYFMRLAYVEKIDAHAEMALLAALSCVVALLWSSTDE